jgi:hypothetical protein
MTKLWPLCELHLTWPTSSLAQTSRSTSGSVVHLRFSRRADSVDLPHKVYIAAILGFRSVELSCFRTMSDGSGGMPDTSVRADRFVSVDVAGNNFSMLI